MRFLSLLERTEATGLIREAVAERLGINARVDALADWHEVGRSGRLRASWSEFAACLATQIPTLRRRIFTSNCWRGTTL